MLYIWLAVIVALVLVEIFSRNLTAACFIASAIIAAICTLFHEEYVLEVCLFLIIGVLLLIFVRPNVLIHLKNYEKHEDKKEKNKKDSSKTKEIKKDSKKSSKTKKSVKK